MARDNFATQMLDTLAKRVGVRCSNPSCRKLTTGPRTESHHIVNIGVGAHITAASSGGPRYEPSLTAEQRQSPENGVWLCQNCAKLIDNDPNRYPVEILRDWKTRAEASALAEIEGKAELEPTDLSAELDLSYEKDEGTKRHDYRLHVKLANLGTETLGEFHIESNSRSAGSRTFESPPSNKALNRRAALVVFEQVESFAPRVLSPPNVRERNIFAAGVGGGPVGRRWRGGDPITGERAR